MAGGSEAGRRAFLRRVALFASLSDDDLGSLSRVTARRYLDHLVHSGRVELVMRYGSPGRPEHRYHLVGSTMLAGPTPGQA